MTTFKKDSFKLADSTVYDKPNFDYVRSEPNISYTRTKLQHKVEDPHRVKYSFKILVVATIVNFTLLLLMGGLLTYFLTRTATKLEVRGISQALSASIPTGPPQGMKGDIGEPGSPGAKGDNGTIGQKGENGLPGAKGLKGNSGMAGTKGSGGTKGELGEKGSQGPVGPIGAKGEVGSPGAQGTRGLTGQKGERGIAGHSGAKGDTGSAGLKGERGIAGHSGAKGDTGSAGLKGERGIAGHSGAKGDTGSAGLKGERGIAGPPGPPPSIVGGATYVRWGRSLCRSGAQRLYSGQMGATFADYQGGAANYICMPPDPQYTLSYRPGRQGLNTVLGTEYEDSFLGRSQHNAWCAVCYLSNKHTTVMLPARTSCPSGWEVEYIGYLMSETHSKYRTMYVCVDTTQESIPGSQHHANGGHLYNVEADCNLGCPPYNNYKELGCVVCSR